MRPIYCTDSQDRIPLEFFAQGKAIWAGGRPYLKENALRLGLKPDPMPPVEFAAPVPKPLDKPAGQVNKLPNAVVAPEVKAVPATPANVPKPPVLPVSAPKPPAAPPVVVAKAPPPADKLHVKDAPIKDALVASTVLPDPKPAGLAPSEPLKQLLKDIATKHDDGPVKPVVLGPAARKIESPPLLQKTQLDGEPKPAAAAPSALSAEVAKKQATPIVVPDAVVKPAVPVPPQKPVAEQKPALEQIKIEQPKAAELKPSVPPNAPSAAIPEVKSDIAQTPSTPAGAAKKQAAPDAIVKAAVPIPQEPAAEQKPPIEQTRIEQPKTVEPKPVAPPPVSDIAFLQTALAEPAIVVPKPPKVPAPPTVAAPPPTIARGDALERTILDSEPFRAELRKLPPVSPAIKPPVAGVAMPPAPTAPKPPAKTPAAAPAKPVAAAKAMAEEEEMKLRIPLQPGEPLSLDEMKHLEILEGIPEGSLKMLYGGIVRREFKRGDVICKQGEYASTAFYVLSGKAEVYVQTPDQIALGTLKKKKNNGAKGILERLKFWVQGRKEGPRKSITGRRPDIENDQSHLPPELRRAELNAGDLFGEMSCINFYPRSMNVRATEDCVMLEIIRTVLDTIRTRKGKYKEKLEKNYRDRSLAQHLNSIPLFKDLDPEFIDQLRKKVKLQDFEPGEVIFRQGDVPDAFYLVRRGCIKVTQTQPGGDLVLTYLGQNDSFGEIGLLRNVKRTATCTALDHVEVVKIEKAHFDFLTHCYDEFKARMDNEIEERLASGRSVTARPPARALDEFINQELMQAQNVLLLDLEKCTRCDECVQACIDSHDDGKTRLVREGLRFDKYLLATSCRSCMDPVCMIGCPVGSIRREETFEIIIEDWCIGCEKCAKQCPYGNIKMHEFPRSQDEIDRDIEAAKRKNAQAALKVPAAQGHPAPPDKDPALKVALVKDIAVTCDQCSTLQEPSCVYACPHEAAMRVNARDFFEIVGKSTLKDKPKSVKTE